MHCVCFFSRTCICTAYYCVYKKKWIMMYCVARHLQCTVCSFLFVYVYVLCKFRLTVYTKERVCCERMCVLRIATYCAERNSRLIMFSFLSAYTVNRKEQKCCARQCRWCLPFFLFWFLFFWGKNTVARARKAKVLREAVRMAHLAGDSGAVLRLELQLTVSRHLCVCVCVCAELCRYHKPHGTIPLW